MTYGRDLELSSPSKKRAKIERRVAVRKKQLEEGNTTDQFLDYKDVPEGEFGELVKHCTAALYSYNHATGDLAIKVMPSTAHDSAAGVIQDTIGTQIISINPRYQLDTLHTSIIRFGQWTKQADCSWGPENNGPTAVVETGLSESTTRSIGNARGWIESVGSTVNIAITVNIDTHQPFITICKWVYGARQSSVGLQSARQASPSAAIRTTVYFLDRQNNTMYLFY
ncbi:uncharacterized protein ASPGLDRAFT_54484 [Aspergillus glaucus CBS 516.65]|uniref:Uncharacterized protein n=1 Tax=Aspergillus glaucus CBS 516.65 TaxID=1160497 RepID=A0A1L9VWZ9_ASPGL|nr:hypothetical protein ASPGLDRAFT_54484 [Aspergillus glaucus CBS 516.65]OJJ88425.1 hypothetical protein ASPGLDRAFT_54484 [Aspergillus glaucus CBS 516.65]